MAIGGDNIAMFDVELLSLDPISRPVPDCLTYLNPLPQWITGAAGALDYSGESIFMELVSTATLLASIPLLTQILCSPLPLPLLRVY